jgi:serine/threonine protein kinase/tetratricopeptide (TPR) repeat protein
VTTPPTETSSRVQHQNESRDPSRLASQGDGASADVPRMERLLDDLLCVPPGERSVMLEDLCEAYPEDAASLRQRYEALDRMGMLEHEAPAPPVQIGAFHILEQIGAGGMGVVYRAHQEDIGRIVAIKVLRPEFAWLLPNRQRFLREARVVAQLEHPAIVPVLQFGEHDGQPFLVMRHIAGRSLAGVLSSLDESPVAARTGDAIVRALAEGPEGVDEVAVGSALHGLETRWSHGVVRLLLPIAEGLGHAHARGVVHRDVKPSNILISREGQAHMCDFGLASLDHDDQLTRSGALLGSVPYMAPEQVEGLPTDSRSDVFSFGSVLYEALFGRRPFGKTSSSETMHAIARMDPPSLAAGPPHVEKDLLAIVARCLEKRSTHRYKDGVALAHDLRNYLSNRPVSARRLTYVRRVARFARREPVRCSLIAATGALLMLLASLAGYLWAEQETLAAGRDTLRGERLERDLALGYHALVTNQVEMAQQYFDRCLAIDDRSEAAQTGAWLLQPQPVLAAPNALPEDASQSERFRRATRLMYTGPRGDNRGHQRAVALLQQVVLCADKARPIYHGMLAAAAAGAEENELAARTAAALLRIWPDSATALYWAGSAMIGVDPDGASRSLSRAIAIDPAFAAAWAELGAVRLLQGANGRAVTALETATQLEPSNAKAWLDLGLAHQQAEDLDAAEACLRHAMAMPNSVPGASYNLGVLLADRDPEAAIAAFEQTTARASDYAEAWYNLGALRTRRGDLEQGHRAFQRAVTLRPDWINAWRQVGTNRAKAADLEATVAAFRRIVALAPDDQDAAEYLDMLQQHIDATGAKQKPIAPTAKLRD